jgi:hypothetical protein
VEREVLFYRQGWENSLDSESDRDGLPFEERGRVIAINPDAAMKIQPELVSGETLLWAAMPNVGVVLHSEDWSLIPFSLLWGGFTIFWEASVLGYWGNSPKKNSAPTFFALWGFAFVLAGQYFIWGRFLKDAWLKRKTYYGVTNRRVLIVQEGWKRKIRSCYLEAIPEIVREGETTGTLWLGQKLSMFAGRRSPKRSMSRFDFDSVVPVLADIDDVDSVYRLIMQSREQSRKVDDRREQDLSFPER